MRNVAQICFCAILLFACSSSSNHPSLFDVKKTDGTKKTESFHISPQINNIFNKRDINTPTQFEHIPINNPGGAQFESDPDFVKSYNLYKKRTEIKIIGEDVTESIPLQTINEFAAYKLMGAKEVDTRSADWNIDYIPAPKHKSIKDKIIESALATYREQSSGFGKHHNIFGNSTKENANIWNKNSFKKSPLQISNDDKEDLIDKIEENDYIYFYDDEDNIITDVYSDNKSHYIYSDEEEYYRFTDSNFGENSLTTEIHEKTEEEKYYEFIDSNFDENSLTTEIHEKTEEEKYYEFIDSNFDENSLTTEIHEKTEEEKYYEFIDSNFDENNLTTKIQKQLDIKHGNITQKGSCLSGIFALCYDFEKTTQNNYTKKIHCAPTDYSKKEIKSNRKRQIYTVIPKIKPIM